MPFSGRTTTSQGLAPWDELYRDHIKPVVEASGLRCFRADEIVRPGSVIADVVEAVASAFLVVAEMTGQNPNVFYELGVRHALSKRTLLLSQTADDIPFDLRDNRTIIYSFTPRGAKQLEDVLRQAITTVIASPDHCDNPVQSFLRARGDVKSEIVEAKGALDVRENIAVLRRQNQELWSAVNELKKALHVGQPESKAGDIVGTWTDEFGRQRVEKFFTASGDQLVMAYGGVWPGCAWGRFDGEMYRFVWSRFDRSLAGNGVLRLVAPTRLEGGLWFGPDSEPNSEPLEKHVLSRVALDVLPQGLEWLERARAFLGTGRSHGSRSA
jgi:hypothetical protein